MRAFNEISWSDFKSNLIKSIKEAIIRRGETYLMSVDEEEFIQYLIAEYALEPLEIIESSKEVKRPKKATKRLKDPYYGEYYNKDVYECVIEYKYTGSGELFNVQPSHFYLTSYDIVVSEHSNTISFKFDLYSQDPNAFNAEHDSAYNAITKNLPGVNSEVAKFDIEDTIRTLVANAKEKVQAEHSFFAAINVEVNPNTTSVFTVPTIKKKDIPQVPAAKKKEFTADPAMSKSMYEDVLKVTYDFGKSLEKKTSTYKGKQEEDLRDLFVTILETRYDDVTATGETFNKDGKTDILLKYAADGSNLFVGECKIWKGPAGYNEAINQIFDRYLTWRDSKVAIILFVSNNDFTNVLEAIKTTTRTHPYYVQDNGQRGESSFSYIFHLPSDKSKLIYLEVMAFHFDKLKSKKILAISG